MYPIQNRGQRGTHGAGWGGSEPWALRPLQLGDLGRLVSSLWAYTQWRKLDLLCGMAPWTQGGLDAASLAGFIFTLLLMCPPAPELYAFSFHFSAQCWTHGGNSVKA